MTNGNGRAWQVLHDLPSWQVTQIPRRPHARPGSSPGQDQAGRGAAQRLQALVSAFHYGAPVVLGWAREQAAAQVAGLLCASADLDGMDYPLLIRMPDGTSRETSQPAPVTSPVSLIISRSSTCGSECRGAPCSLRQVRSAQRAASSDPRIALRAELSVLAHLTGWTMPMPGLAFAAALAGTKSRLRDCALSHAVDSAVAARVPVLSARIGGPTLASHVVAAMHAALDEDRWLCGQQELRAVGYGTRPASAIEQAVGARAGDPGWEQCLAGALTAFQDCGWPLDLLRPAGRDDER